MSKDEKRLKFLKKSMEMIIHNLRCYSTDYTFQTPKKRI